MAQYEMAIRLIPGYGYSTSSLYRTAETKSQYNKLLKEMKDLPGSHTIEVGGVIRETWMKKGSGAQTRWRKV